MCKKKLSESKTAVWWREYRKNGAKRKFEYKDVTKSMLDLNGITVVSGNVFRNGVLLPIHVRHGKPGPKYPNGKETLWIYFKDAYRTEDEKDLSSFYISLQSVVYAYDKGCVPGGCVVHHLDENTYNNDLSNLQLMTRSEHSQVHKNDRKKFASNGKFCKEYYKSRQD